MLQFHHHLLFVIALSLTVSKFAPSHVPSEPSTSSPVLSHFIRPSNKWFAMTEPSTEEFSAGSIVIGSDAKFTVRLKSPSLEAVFSASADVLFLLSLAALLSLPQPASMEKRKLQLIQLIPISFHSTLLYKFIDKTGLPCITQFQLLPQKSENSLKQDNGSILLL